MHLVRIAAIASFVVVAASGCSQQSLPSNIQIDQANLCEVKEWNRDSVSSSCKPGQKVVFLPPSFGNQQFPVIFAAVNCDLRYTVVLTTGAVTCIYSPTPIKAKGDESAVPGKP